jgi:large subunit ribosomal protein L33
MRRATAWRARCGVAQAATEVGRRGSGGGKENGKAPPLRSTGVASSPKKKLHLPPSTTGIRCIVTLECTEARAEGATPTRYTTQKNRKNTPERLEIKKYNKYLKRHTVHKEIK